MSNHHLGPLSPPPTASSDPHSAVPQHAVVTHKSHRLRTSPVPGEGSALVPVVKFSQSFTERNALRGIRPVYGTTSTDVIQEESDIVSITRPRVEDHDARARGWTISITSSNQTEDEIQVEVQQHLESATTAHMHHPDDEIRVSRSGGLLGGAESRGNVQSHGLDPIIPTFVTAPTLAHDRSVITDQDLSRMRVKSTFILVLGIVFPPLWLFMGWGHTFDGFILPDGGRTSLVQRQRILEAYRPYRRAASGLGVLVVAGSFVGIIVGTLALCRIIV
jgi:hypothetical protein